LILDERDRLWSAKIDPIPLRGRAEDIQSFARNTLLTYRAEVPQSAISTYISVISNDEQFPLRDLRGAKLPQVWGRVSDMLNVRLVELVPVYEKHIIFALYCVATYSHHSFNEKQTLPMKNHDVVRFWLRVSVLPQIN
jgi:hypothetical protein